MKEEISYRLRVAQENKRTVVFFFEGFESKVGRVTRFDDEKIFLEGEKEPILRKNVKFYDFH